MCSGALWASRRGMIYCVGGSLALGLTTDARIRSRFASDGQTIPFLVELYSVYQFANQYTMCLLSLSCESILQLCPLLRLLVNSSCLTCLRLGCTSSACGLECRISPRSLLVRLYCIMRSCLIDAYTALTYSSRIRSTSRLLIASVVPSIPRPNVRVPDRPCFTTLP
jgi:hypothetical protein